MEMITPVATDDLEQTQAFSSSKELFGAPPRPTHAPHLLGESILIFSSASLKAKAFHVDAGHLLSIAFSEIDKSSVTHIVDIELGYWSQPHILVKVARAEGPVA